ncbi:flagella synthesis protein FlgN [Trinickia symbiotica]|uniref:Flagellar protein FlgN n=1 Tax=Trinickia symbiotica TaxID=863227 RepID=A0A2N7WN53_9BURK|nr:flagellar protein FlgN [Trinickia symbiotica]PMS30814.1 flagellar protein FlgN [Trinickia symbiotica]PPK41519.1 flagella synthesis protein FlgN [Trinickia symbiotica]
MKDVLLNTLIEEHATLEAFASLLAYEQKALAEVSPLEKLPPIIEKKTELTEKLASLEKQRDGQLRQMGLPAGWKGMELAGAGDARVANQWKLLQGVVQRARHANLTNGMMIRVRMNYNEKALAVLRGASSSMRGGAATVYGPDGRMSAV